MRWYIWYDTTGKIWRSLQSSASLAELALFDIAGCTRHEISEALWLRLRDAQDDWLVVDGTLHRSSWTVQAGELVNLTEIVALPSAPVPDKVTGTQAKRALVHAGLYEAIELYVLSAEAYPNGITFRIVWDAADWYRNSSELNEIASALGLSQEQIDNLFRLAATL